MINNLTAATAILGGWVPADSGHPQLGMGTKSTQHPAVGQGVCPPTAFKAHREQCGVWVLCGAWMWCRALGRVCTVPAPSLLPCRTSS